MIKLWEQPLRRQLFVFILLLLVPVLAAAAWSGFATYDERIGDLHERTRVVAMTIAATIGREVTAMDRLTRNMDGRRAPGRNSCASIRNRAQAPALSG